MPHTRRRRFSVRDSDVVGRNSKLQNGSTSLPSPESEVRLTINNVVATKSSIRYRTKLNPNSSKNSGLLPVAESSAFTIQDDIFPSITVDKDVTASSSNIDLYNIVSASKDSSYAGRLKTATWNVTQKRSIETEKRDSPIHSRERTTMKSKQHQHRMKVRSPKRRISVAVDQMNKSVDDTKCSTGTCAIDWGAEIQLYSVDDISTLIDTTEDEERFSTHSFDDMCRICHGGESLSSELGRLISACSCRGTVGRVHVKCLERWLTESGKSRCELCGSRYATKRVHKYGVPRALLMWVLSHNAKQLMVDSLGIMLMSPLAVLAAWLSGRTLAGLMTQESSVTPWPLASTFVLACMTLCLYYREWIMCWHRRRGGFQGRGLSPVCYYCWIVSAATRHALGWWIWYRSQYEVRLQLPENEEQLQNNYF